MTPTALGALIAPALLYAGLGAAAIPIVIHLLSKRRYRRVYWAATDFLIEAHRQNRRRVRMQELVLLALRCLAMFFVGLMLSRWFLRPQALAAVLGASGRTERIVLLDDSFSMGARVASEPLGDNSERESGRAGERGNAPNATRNPESSSRAPAAGGTTFDSAKSTVARLATWLQQESPGDPFTIVLTSRPDAPLRTEPTIGKMDAAWRSELNALAPSARTANLPAAFAAIRGLLDTRPHALAATVYVVSDFQQIDWGGRADRTGTAAGDSGAGSAANHGPASALAGWGGGRKGLRVVMMDVAAPVGQNLCVSAIEPQQAQTVAGVSAAFTARVTNYGERDATPSLMSVFVGDAAQPGVPVPVIAAGQTVEVPFEVTFANEGAETLTVELAADALPADNTRSLVVPVARGLRVLIVNGEPSADPYADEAFLLTVALRPEGPQFSGNEVTVVDENEFEATDLGNFHAVVLANVYRVSEDTAERLEQYAAAGGGVAIFLGDQVDADLYNRVLYRDGKGLLPARLGDVITPPADRPVGIGEINTAHPLMRRFRDSDVPYFQGVQAYRYFACEPAAIASSAPATAPSAGSLWERHLAGPTDRLGAGSTQSRPSDRLEAGPTTTQPASARNGTSPTTRPGESEASVPAYVLLRFDDVDKHPAMLERAFGSGRVFLSATTADKEWTNLPDRPVFLVLAMELVQYLARPAASGGQQLVGSPIHIAIDSGRFQSSATLRTPNYPQEPAIRVEARQDAVGGPPAIGWSHTDTPGIYRFTLTDATGGPVARPVAVNVDPDEGNLKRASRAELLEAMRGLPAEYLSGEELSHSEETNARRELWPAVLITLTALLMSEQALAWWFGSSGRPAGRKQEPLMHADGRR
jgi:hypothetical protein